MTVLSLAHNTHEGLFGSTAEGLGSVIDKTTAEDAWVDGGRT